MDPGDLNDAYTVRSLDDLAKIYAQPLPRIATKETDHITDWITASWLPWE